MPTSPETSFPLRRVFLAGVLPGLLLFIGTVIFATAQTVRSATTEVLLQLASAKVDAIAREIAATAPTAWDELQAGRPLAAAELTVLGKTLAREQRETQVALLKIYSADRRTWFSSDGTEVGFESFWTERGATCLTDHRLGATYYDMVMNSCHLEPCDGHPFPADWAEGALVKTAIPH